MADRVDSATAVACLVPRGTVGARVFLPANLQLLASFVLETPAGKIVRRRRVRLTARAGIFVGGYVGRIARPERLALLRSAPMSRRVQKYASTESSRCT